jgi:hypothetical protein
VESVSEETDRARHPELGESSVASETFCSHTRTASFHICSTMAMAVFGGRVLIGYLAAIVAASNAGGSGSVVGDTTAGVVVTSELVTTGDTIVIMVVGRWVVKDWLPKAWVDDGDVVGVSGTTSACLGQTCTMTR